FLPVERPDDRHDLVLVHETIHRLLRDRGIRRRVLDEETEAAVLVSEVDPRREQNSVERLVAVVLELSGERKNDPDRELVGESSGAGDGRRFARARRSRELAGTDGGKRLKPRRNLGARRG